MDMKAAGEHSQHNAENRLPLLTNPSDTEIERKTHMHKAVHQTCKSTARLSNHLPTGTVLAFQLLSPFVTSQGNCSSLGLYLTTVLIALCGISCFILSFTDSFKDAKGKICFGFATLHGLWIIDGSAKISPELAANYRLQIMDLIHASMSVLVFMVVAFENQNVIECFFPLCSTKTHEILKAAPLGVGAICSALFVVVPSQRHGIGFTLSANKYIGI